MGITPAPSENQTEPIIYAKVDYEDICWSKVKKNIMLKIFVSDKWKKVDFILPQKFSGTEKRYYKYQILITNVACLISINLKLDICKQFCNIWSIRLYLREIIHDLLQSY